jgi:hypothetical protein
MPSACSRLRGLAIAGGLEPTSTHRPGRVADTFIRGPWQDESWRGWWGEDPPFGHDVFVLTHYPRSDLAMRNGTTPTYVVDLPVTSIPTTRWDANAGSIANGVAGS